MTKKLKTCPFCGGDAFIWGTGCSRYRVTCGNDCVSLPSRMDATFPSEDVAIERWNRRVLTPITESEGKCKDLIEDRGTRP